MSEDAGEESSEKIGGNRNKMSIGQGKGKRNYTYVLRCGDGSLYTGWTNDLERRLQTHNEGRGGKYTRSRLPVKLAYYEEFGTKEEAMRREWEIKQLKRTQKEELVKNCEGSRQVSCRKICCADGAPEEEKLNGYDQTEDHENEFR